MDGFQFVSTKGNRYEIKDMDYKAAEKLAARRFGIRYHVAPSGAVTAMQEAGYNVVMVAGPDMPKAAPTAPVVRLATARQIAYIQDLMSRLGHDWKPEAGMTMAQASAMINQIREGEVLDNSGLTGISEVY